MLNLLAGVVGVIFMAVPEECAVPFPIFIVNTQEDCTLLMDKSLVNSTCKRVFSDEDADDFFIPAPPTNPFY